MGGCLSNQNVSQAELKAQKEEKIRTKWIDSSLAKDKVSDRESIKLLFLGAGESGKSTLLKQMTILHRQGFTKEERDSFLALIHSNIISSMKLLIRQSLEYVSTKPQCAISADAQPAMRLVQELKFDDRLTEKAGQAVAQLWQDPGIQATYVFRSQYNLTDSAKYFFDKVLAVCRPSFEPDEQDILRSRIRTTGIVEHRFFIDNNDFRMYDVGGQRNARKKWIHCFQNVTSVIFVAAISAYDQVVVEDNKTNGLVEALNLFEDICTSRWFANTAMILFLNKKDIFQEKVCFSLCIRFAFVSMRQLAHSGVSLFVRAVVLTVLSLPLHTHTHTHRSRLYR